MFRLLALWLLLCVSARAEIRYVILISVDGCRGDYLETFINSAPQSFPNFTRLRAQSASTFTARCDFTESITIPDHLCMLTGRPVRQPAGFPAEVQHGITTDAPLEGDTAHNSGLNAGVYKASIFDVVHDRGLGTAIYLGKQRMAICDRSWNADNGAPDLIGVDNGRDKIDVRELVEASQPGTTATMLADFVSSIQQTKLQPFTFFHIADTDYAGHAYGWDPTPSSTYRNAVRMADGWLGQILNSIDANPVLAGHVALLLTADHGGGTPINTHTDATQFTNYTIPFFLMAPGIAGGTSIYDWLENRFAIGTERPDYTAPRQPVRNGDAANLLTALLGLPPVPGSFLKADLKKPLLVAREEDAIQVSWPVYLTGYTLEMADTLVGDHWQPVTTGVQESQGWLTCTVSPPLPTARFFRLRAPAFETAATPSARQPATAKPGGKVVRKSSPARRRVR